MFEAIQIDEKLASKYSLVPVRLKGLGPMVAITGPNGAGKTRLLDLLTEQLQADRKEFERLATLVSPEDGDKGRYFNAVTANAQSLEETLDENSNRGRNVAALKRFVSRYRPRAGDWRECFRARHWPRIVRLSANSNSTGRYRWKSDEPIDIGLRDFPQDTLDQVAQARYLTDHPSWPRDRDRLVDRAKAFAATVEALLDAPFGVEVRDTQIAATLNGRLIDAEDLSEGQRLLLRWTEIIHDEVDDVRDALLLIDEPELHLHPAALIDAMERLRKLEPAQILVATHSVPLLAWIGPAQIFRMARGTPSWAGSRVDQALAGLLGGEDGVETLRTFLSDAGSLAFHQFAAECLLPPGIVGERDEDPQAEGFVASIGRLLQANDDEVRVLEYGAGKGRLIAALATNPLQVRTRLRYFAHNDPRYISRDDAEACRHQLARLYESVAAAPAVSSDLRAHQLEAAEKMHAVVLCNVLHEVPPRKWPKL
ncbi:MAG TPA: ATP-binding protein, partial [Enhygromyxa sp.]|nr:ATP-binding protein [Enhygromyxa sp.]